MDSSERIEYSRPADLPGLEVLRVERVARRWYHFHETYAVCTGLDSQGREFEWTYRRKRHAAKDRGMMLMEPGEVHANTRITPPCTFRVLFIAPQLVGQAAVELGLKHSHPHFRAAHVAEPQLVQSFLRFHESLEYGAALLERESRAAACIGALLSLCTESVAPPLRQPGRAALLRAREFIHEHCFRPISLNELAAAASLSRFHLARSFAREFGLPPHLYQIQLQLNRGRDLLRVGMMPAAVAAELGFADQSHFGRHFKRTYGISPGRYVRQLRRR